MLQVEIDNEVLWGGSLPNLNSCSETEDPFEGEPGVATEFPFSLSSGVAAPSSPCCAPLPIELGVPSHAHPPLSHTLSHILPNHAELVQHVP